MHISLMSEVTDEVVQAFQRLLPQLTRSNPPPTWEDLLEMAQSDQVFVFLARDSEQKAKIIGSATLATYLTPTGRHGWIEDVVVDQDYRRQGIGNALTEACLDQARALGLNHVNLTSRSVRCAANQLYQSMGFIRRETNLYRYPLQGD